MKVSDAFPSNYLKAEDLNGASPTVTIEEVTLEEIGQGRNKETKMILAFVGKAKRMVLNKTNASTISKLYGDDTDNWINQKITIAAREVEFQGDMVLALRVSLQKPAAQQQRQPATDPAPLARPQPPKKPSQQAAPDDSGEDADSIPF